MTQRQMVNRLKVLLQAKELSGNLRSDTFSTLRGISVQGGGQGQHFPVTTSSCICPRLHFSPPNHWTAQLRQQGADGGREP